MHCFNQAVVAQCLAGQLATGEVQGSHPGKEWIKPLWSLKKMNSIFDVLWIQDEFLFQSFYLFNHRAPTWPARNISKEFFFTEDDNHRDINLWHPPREGHITVPTNLLLKMACKSQAGFELGTFEWVSTWIWNWWSEPLSHLRWIM